MKSQSAVDRAPRGASNFKRRVCVLVWSMIALVFAVGVVLGEAAPGRTNAGRTGTVGQGASAAARVRAPDTASGAIAGDGEFGACCDPSGECVGDLAEVDCGFGDWHRGASCGADRNLPAPVCAQSTCGYDNGGPLDDGGAQRSQYAPDTGAAFGAADDFVLNGGGFASCRITGVRAWMTHDSLSVNPTVDYQGVNVTIYTTGLTGLPNGHTETDGSHSATATTGIRYTQRVAMADISVTQQLPECLTDLWQLDIPVEMVLPEGQQLWLEIQPIMNASKGAAYHVLSVNNNDDYALGYDVVGGVWQEVSGNTSDCPASSPPPGTRRNLAFDITGVESTGPVSDDCADAWPVGDGIVSFNTTGATTDGPPVPVSCDFFGTDQTSADVWFDYLAECTGELTVSLCGSNFDTELAVYAGCDTCPPREDPLACNEDATEICGVQSHVTLPVTFGDCLTIRAGGWRGATGRGLLKIDCVAPQDPTGACCSAGQCLGTMTQVECDAASGNWFAGGNCLTFACPVVNDLCATSIPVFTDVAYEATSAGATGNDISSCGSGDSRDVWHHWTADCDGAVDISLCDSAFDTTIAVYDACGGAELACNDDFCGSQSAINPQDRRNDLVVPVTVGETLYIRVSGFGGAVGHYSLLVNGCVNNGCCLNFPAGRCLNVDPAICVAGGSPLPDGVLCQGDGNDNLIDDACESCAAATIASADPSDGTVDARQPSEPGAALPRQGIGSSGEPIVITLDPPAVGAEGCFSLCETAADPVAGPNDIATVTYLGSGRYRIVLDHAIAVGAVTTIEYTGDGSYVSYTSHPSNVDADAAADDLDVIALIDCCLSDLCAPPWGTHSCDIDHSGSAAPGDVLRVIDLLNGADVYDVWAQSSRPVNASCP